MNKILSYLDCYNAEDVEYGTKEEDTSGVGTGTLTNRKKRMDESSFRYILRVVAPVCIAAAVSIALGLLVLLFTVGFAPFLITTLLTFCGFLLGLRRGDQIIRILGCFKDRWR